MKKRAMVLAVTGLVAAVAAIGQADTSVVQSLTGSPGDWTYTFTLTNGESRGIWQWAVWFPSNPSADSVTAGTANWSATDLNTQGFFPEEYTAFWGCHVYDSSSNDLAGPNGEPGFFNTYASDYTSGNAEEYWDGDSWEPLPDPLPAYPDPVWDAIWRGGDYGWNGAGANIQTSDAIDPGGTGQFTVHSTAQAALPGPKGFSYNTTDYWFSYFDGTDDHLDFEGSGTTLIPEPGALGLAGVPLLGLVRRRRRS